MIDRLYSQLLIQDLKALYDKGLRSESLNQYHNPLELWLSLTVACRAMDGALLELSELVCRNRRAQEAAQNALLPEDLKQALW